MRARMTAILLALLAAGLPVAAQSPSLPQEEPPAPRSKPPPAGPPQPGAPSDENLSRRLQRDGGVIRPPNDIAPDNTIVPNDPGRIRIIPPPGSPQGDSTVKPK